ncbi:hypothetical protein RQP46_002791 [Phenoliferia psychrophenolica]
MGNNAFPILSSAPANYAPPSHSPSSFPYTQYGSPSIGSYTHYPYSGGMAGYSSYPFLPFTAAGNGNGAVAFEGDAAVRNYGYGSSAGQSVAEGSSKMGAYSRRSGVQSWPIQSGY